MFAKLALFTAATMAVFVAAAPAPGGINNSCNTGPVQCCNQLFEAEDESYKGILSLLGVVLGPVTGQVGLNCSPLTLIGLGSGASCTSQPVCCSDNQFNGLVNVGCSPVALGLVNFGTVLFPLSRFPVQGTVCQIWAGCLLGGASASLVALNINVVSRVYDLYSREWKIGVLVLGLLLLQFMCNIWFSHSYLQENIFDPLCNIIGFDKRIMILVCNTMLTQTVLWGLVTKKTSGPLGSRTRAIFIYENTYIYGLIFALTIILTPIAVFDGVVRPGLILLWPQTLISIVTCRMILNDSRQEARESQGLAIIFDNAWAKDLSDSDCETEIVTLDNSSDCF
ncbi:hypothetical protein CVT24_006335 [Panaeolus cyanescens]|uniref:Hydrophobin n=1 Tax=Panaeolus cyanescens TaxID=181874 RepID=A0A409YEA0_9AGAR|nr:hypothetical protein CVT24_006335 [Panaeolus cyanescens]